MWLMAILAAATAAAAEPSLPPNWQVIDGWKEASSRPLPTNSTFFPPPTTSYGGILLPNYEKLLQGLGESSLHGRRTNADEHAYRLLYRPAFAPPLVVYVQRQGEKAQLTLYAWGYRDEPSMTQPPFRLKLEVPTAKWAGFVKRLERSGFWERPPHRDMPEYLDGVGYVLEALDHGRYHLVDRMGGDDDAFVELCERLLKWAPVQHGRFDYFLLKDSIAQRLREYRPRVLVWKDGEPVDRRCPVCRQPVQEFGSYAKLELKSRKDSYDLYYCPSHHVCLLDMVEGFVQPADPEDQARIDARFQAHWRERFDSTR
jgi:hypothetical protein